MMTSKERVMTAFRFEEPDHVPAWLGASPEFRALLPTHEAVHREAQRLLQRRRSAPSDPASADPERLLALRDTLLKQLSALRSAVMADLRKRSESVSTAEEEL